MLKTKLQTMLKGVLKIARGELLVEASGFETFGFESSEQSKTLWTLLKARKVERPQSAALFQRMAPKSFTKLCEYSMSLAHR